MQVDPIKPKLKPAINRLKLGYDVPLSNFAFNFNLRHYIMYAKVGRCRSVVSKLVLKVPMVSALETIIL